MNPNPFRIRLTALVVVTLLSAPVPAQLGPGGTQSWDQSSPGVGIAMEAFAHFGRALAAGDFDCDGFDDLAIGMPGEDLVGATDGGRLLVLFSAGHDGLSSVDREIWGQNSPVIEDDAENSDQFSTVLAAGDFNDDGCDDLVVGVPFENIGAEADAGAVNVIYGSAEGLSGDFDDFWHQDLANIDGVAQAGDHFGRALAVGDFDADGYADLAIGAPGEDIGANVDAGAIHVLWGTFLGLNASASLTLYRTSGLAGAAQAGESLGNALAAGNFVPLFAGDDLAVGASGRDVAGFDQAGGLVLISDLGGAVFNTTYTQDSAGVPGVAEDFDRFGATLAGGDFDGDGFDELAVGTPDEDLEGPLVGSVGSVTILDFDGDAVQQWLQDDLAPEQSEIGDEFGRALAVGDFDADGIDDLVVGVPEENLGPVVDGGLIHLLYGQLATGLGTAGHQIFIQPLNPAESGDQFGFAFAVGHFSGHSGTDLAIGAPFVQIGALDETGAVGVYSSIALFLDGLESGDTAEWSSTED